MHSSHIGTSCYLAAASPTGVFVFEAKHDPKVRAVAMGHTGASRHICLAGTQLLSQVHPRTGACVREHPALPGLVSEHPGCMSDRLDTPSMMPRVTGGFRGQVSGRQMYVSLLNDINRWRGRHPDRSRQIMVHLYTCTTPGNPATCWCPHHHRQANLWGPHHQIHRFSNENCDTGPICLEKM
jgi:hypothetical protein